MFALLRRIGGNLKWVTCGTEFIVADVVRWCEPIWKPQARASKKKPAVIGKRCVTGQIIRIDRAGWVHIKVVACTAEAAPHWLRPMPPPLAPGEIIRRQHSKIGQGKVVRLPWSDETARAAVVGSRFVEK